MTIIKKDDRVQDKPLPMFDYTGAMNDELQEYHILIIDDDRDDHFFFTNAVQEIRSSGITGSKKINVSSVYNGAQGINFLLKKGAYKDSPEPLPDFIVLDLFMPIVNGYVVLNEIRARPALKDIPVFILTSSEPDNKQRCLAGGCAGFFSKPPKVAELKTVILQMFKHFK